MHRVGKDHSIEMKLDAMPLKENDKSDSSEVIAL